LDALEVEICKGRSWLISNLNNLKRKISRVGQHDINIEHIDKAVLQFWSGVTVNFYCPKIITPGVEISREKRTPGVSISWENMNPPRK